MGWIRMPSLALVVFVVFVVGCTKGGAGSVDAAAVAADSGSIASTGDTRHEGIGLGDIASMGHDASAPESKTPQELLDDHRKDMAVAAEDGHYTEVCKGTPWVNATLCNWAAAKADGKGVERPDGEIFRAYFAKEHWKHVYGTIIDDAGNEGDYEVSVGGYRHHCILDTDETKFSTKGAFNMWVQEQPTTREVTVNSGATQQWVVLEEATLAKILMDLAHSGGGIEATALAKNAMGLFATYVPYAEKKGDPPALPSEAPAAASGAAVAAASPPARATPVAQATPPIARAPDDPTKRAAARADCLRKCVGTCGDDSACERTCAAKCPPG